jgi:hypothetical protein
MSQQKTLVVVGLIASEEAEDDDLPYDLEELSPYELDIRLRVGRSVPDRVLILIESQSELKELIAAIEGQDMALDIMTDDPSKPKPATLDDLWELLPQGEAAGGNDAPADTEDPFRIL